MEGFYVVEGHYVPTDAGSYDDGNRSARYNPCVQHESPEAALEWAYSLGQPLSLKVYEVVRKLVMERGR